MDNVSKAKRSEIMSRIRSRWTGPERRLRMALVREGAGGFRCHERVFGREVDFCFREARVAVQVHGCFFHGHDCRGGKLPKTRRAFWRDKIEGNRRRDAELSLSLARNGWELIELWECELRRHGYAAPILALQLSGACRPRRGSPAPSRARRRVRR